MHGQPIDTAGFDEAIAALKVEESDTKQAYWLAVISNELCKAIQGLRMSSNTPTDMPFFRLMIYTEVEAEALALHFGKLVETQEIVFDRLRERAERLSKASTVEEITEQARQGTDEMRNISSTIGEKIDEEIGWTFDQQNWIDRRFDQLEKEALMEREKRENEYKFGFERDGLILLPEIQEFVDWYNNTENTGEDNFKLRAEVRPLGDGVDFWEYGYSLDWEPVERERLVPYYEKFKASTENDK